MDIRGIAKRAKVSTATVSRTINHIPTVDPRLAKRVWRVIDELGYFPNTQARALVSGRSRILGLVVSEITNPFFPEIVQVFENVAVSNNYEILLTSTGHDPKRMETAVRRMIEHRVEGVAVMTFGMEESLLQRLKRRNIPIAIVDVGPPSPRVSNIRVDYQQGLRQAVQHLAAIRHERIAFISGPLRLPSARARLEAFKSAMREVDLPTPHQWIMEGTHTIEGGIEAAGGLLALSPRPSAIMCSNDMTALGVMRKSYELGIRIPHDLSLVGFDNIRISEFVLPPLTTIEMSQAELATLAFHALLAELEREKPSPTGTQYSLQTRLILRESTARPATPSKPARLRGSR